MPTQRTIRFHSDKYLLVGTLHLPDTSSPKPAVVIGCHGLLANRQSEKQIALALACNQKGLAYFRFDHRGCGESHGRFNKVTSLATRREDLYHAVETMQHHSSVGDLAGLFGSSFGGTVVLAHAADHPGPALITYAAPINSTDIHHDNIRDNNGAQPSATLMTGALSFDIAGLLPSINNILVCHSQDDETVPVTHAHQIHKLSKKPKHMHLFSNGDHRMSGVGHQRQFEQIFIDWIIRGSV